MYYTQQPKSTKSNRLEDNGAPQTQLNPRRDTHTHSHANKHVWKQMGRPKPLSNTRQTNTNHLKCGGNCGAPNTPRKTKRLETYITTPSNIHVSVFPRKPEEGDDGRRRPSSNSLGGSKHPLQAEDQAPNTDSYT
jgi:hypothetical protein